MGAPFDTRIMGCKRPLKSAWRDLIIFAVSATNATAADLEPGSPSKGLIPNPMSVMSRSQASQTDRTARPRFVALGLVHHQAGRFSEAEALYLQALEEQTNSADALYLLGVLRHQHGNALEAVSLLTNALAIAPNHPEAHNNIGVALRGLGRLADAAESYREALRLRPDYPGAHNNLGNVLGDLGRLAEAEASCWPCPMAPSGRQPGSG